jgi:phage terminase large subunit-like protein
VIFGSLDDEGVRHVPEVFALVGKKNSKTTSGAGLMVTALLMNGKPAPRKRGRKAKAAPETAA